MLNIFLFVCFIKNEENISIKRKAFFFFFLLPYKKKLDFFSGSYFPSASWFKLLKKWVLGSQLAENWPLVLAFSPVLCCYLLKPAQAVLVDKCIPGCDDGGLLLLFV